MTAPFSGREDFITIVSGLPRSGTSMMMQLLAAGGITLLSDGRRSADDDNPRGYWELEAVKHPCETADWLRNSKGLAVKVIYRLLYDLPASVGPYRVVFMRRRISEVLVSQRKMLQRRTSGADAASDVAAAAEDAKLAEVFASELARHEAWRSSRGDFTFLDVDYNQLLADPAPGIAAIDDFLGGGLNRTSMTNAISPELYRNRH